MMVDPSISSQMEWRTTQTSKVNFSPYCTNGNFYVYYTRSQLKVIDFMDMKEKSLNVDWKSIIDQSFHIRGVALTTSDTLVVVLENKIDRLICIVILTVDLETCKCFFRSSISKHETSEFKRLYLMNDRFGYLTKNQTLHLYRLTADNIEVVKEVKLPENLVLTGIINDNVYAYEPTESDEFNFKNMVKICLQNGKQTTLKLCDKAINCRHMSFNRVTSQWIGDTLAVSQLEYDKNVGKLFTRLFVLNLGSLKWRTLDVQFQAYFSQLITNNENILIVRTWEHEEANWTENCFYRLIINRPIQLNILAWLSVHKQAQQNPNLDLSQLSFSSSNYS